jgi:hypothetical protein
MSLRDEVVAISIINSLFSICLANSSVPELHYIRGKNKLNKSLELIKNLEHLIQINSLERYKYY